MKEPVLNKHGIQEFVITKIDRYYSVKYTTDADNDIHSHELYEQYGEEKLIEEFTNHMEYGINALWWKEYTVLDVYVYSYEKVDYRRNVEGERYISYDLYREKIQTKLTR